MLSDNKNPYQAYSYQNTCRTTSGTQSSNKPHPHLIQEDFSLCHGSGLDPDLSDVTRDWTELEVGPNCVIIPCLLFSAKPQDLTRAASPRMLLAHWGNTAEQKFAIILVFFKASRVSKIFSKFQAQHHGAFLPKGICKQ